MYKLRYISLEEEITNYWLIETSKIKMEYQKISSLLSDELNQPSKFRTRNWVEVNDETRATYSPNK